ncbi:Uncharacterised protein [Clostridioides difficile]|nr:Uncharacterised protein [Clostridioides difficile]
MKDFIEKFKKGFGVKQFKKYQRFQSQCIVYL